MRFLMLIKHAETQVFRPPKALNDAMEAFIGEGSLKGWLKDTAGLTTTKNGVRIRSKGGKLTTTDGPFTEAKEIIGGYVIVETKTQAEALEIAKRFMELHRIHVPDFECESEVRLCEDV